MITLRVDGVDEVRRHLMYAPKQIPFATAKGLNDIAFAVRRAEMESIKQSFDRPKPQTVRNVWVRKATKTNLSADIYFDQVYDKGFDEYIVPQVEGGGRKQKKSERLLGHYFVPAAGAQIDAYGNMKGSQITQILSQLRKFGEVGHRMNQTDRSKAGRRGAKKDVEYFVVTEQRGGLKPGVYQRKQSGAGFGAKTKKSMAAGAFQKGQTRGGYSSVVRARGIVPVMLFVDRAPKYHKRFPFYEVAHRVSATEGPRLMAAAIEYALRTAR